MPNIEDTLTAYWDREGIDPESKELNFKWGTVISVQPLLVVLDGDRFNEFPLNPALQPAAVAAVSLDDSITTGSRVWCQTWGRKIIVLGGKTAEGTVPSRSPADGAIVSATPLNGDFVPGTYYPVLDFQMRPNIGAEITVVVRAASKSETAQAGCWFDIYVRENGTGARTSVSSPQGVVNSLNAYQPGTGTSIGIVTPTPNQRRIEVFVVLGQTSASQNSTIQKSSIVARPYRVVSGF